MAELLREGLGLQEPFRDPGVGEFGLANVVFAIGDCFIEVVSPIVRPRRPIACSSAPGTTGYMALLDLTDMASARPGQVIGGPDRLADRSAGISGTHLHPADVPGAIVSLDLSEPPTSPHRQLDEPSARAA